MNFVNDFTKLHVVASFLEKTLNVWDYIRFRLKGVLLRLCQVVVVWMSGYFVCLIYFWKLQVMICYFSSFLGNLNGFSDSWLLAQSYAVVHSQLHICQGPASSAFIVLTFKHVRERKIWLRIADKPVTSRLKFLKSSWYSCP